MILWINGPFGVGKSTAVQALRPLLPNASTFDPERFGWLLQRTVSFETAATRTPEARGFASSKADLVGRVASGFAAEAGADGAANAANGVRLAQQLARESANSVFTSSGELTSGAISDSSLIILPGSRIANPEVIKSLTSDGSQISDSVNTRTYQSPSGDFQVHFYMNRTTGVVDYSTTTRSSSTGRPDEGRVGAAH